MRAIVQSRYGEPVDVLSLQDIEPPSIADDQVLVRVGGVCISIGDCHVIRGVPYLMRPAFGLRGPRAGVPGMDLAGTVEAVGSGVTRFEPGDEVFGWGKRVLAEYAAVDEKTLVSKPVALGFGEASAVGVSAQTALQGLRDQAKVRPDEQVLINGASGGVGTFAVQLAKSFGAEVTGVCSTRNLDMVRTIGADHVIDYTDSDFVDGGPRYDIIFDTVGSRPFAELERALKPGGRLLPVGAPVGGWVGGLTHVIKAFGRSVLSRSQLRPFVSINNRDDLASLKQMVDDGEVSPVIDQRFELDDAVAAVAHVATGHARGKTVITV